MNKLYAFLYCQKKNMKIIKKKPFLSLFLPLKRLALYVYIQFVKIVGSA